MNIKQLKKECDAMLTPIAKLLHPECENCQEPTTVGHHWIERSQSMHLTYNIANLIGLCKSCHYKIHNKSRNNIVQSYNICSKIISNRGIVWFKIQEEFKNTKVRYVKADWIEIHEELAYELSVLEMTHKD